MRYLLVVIVTLILSSTLDARAESAMNHQMQGAGKTSQSGDSLKIHL